MGGPRGTRGDVEGGSCARGVTAGTTNATVALGAGMGACTGLGWNALTLLLAWLNQSSLPS